MRVVMNVRAERYREAATNAWRTFIRSVVPTPIACSALVISTDERRCDGTPQRAIATAEAVRPGRVLPGYGLICLSDAFFELVEERQTLALLHEAVHLRLYDGRLAANYEIIRQLNRRIDQATEFERDRDDLAIELLAFAQEVGVDKFIAALPEGTSGPYLEFRAHFYRNPYDHARSPSLALYRLFYRLLRAELGLRVARDPAQREELQRLQRQYDAEFVAAAGKNFPWFRTQQERLLNVSVDTEDRDPDAYRELFDRISGLLAPG